MQLIINVPVPRRRVVAALLLAVALAAPGAALASHLFGDVPDSHTFHGDVSAIALAGITAGCGGGNFCPDNPITRAQEAAFLHRGLGRAAADTGASITVPPATLTTIAQASITPGVVDSAVAGANGFLHVVGNVTLYEGNPDQCICSISVRIYVGDTPAVGTQYVFLPDNTVFESGSASISVVVPVAAGAKTVSLRVQEYQGSESLVAYGSMTALYVPFGATGTDASAPAAAPASSGDDPRP